MAHWKEVARLDVDRALSSLRVVDRTDPKTGKDYRAVEIREPGEEDITSECVAVLVKSRHSDGYYCSVIHNGKSIMALGVDEKSKSVLGPHYRLVKVPGGFLSFRIMKVD